jgi:voltage-gated potassium channel
MADGGESARLTTWQRRTNTPLMVLAVGTMPLLLLDLVSDRLTSLDRAFLFTVNLVVFLAFLADYLVGLMLTSSRLPYARRHIGSLLIVVAQLLALLPALGFLGALRGARAVRPLIAVARLIGLAMVTRQTGRDFLRKRAASVAFAIAGFTLITSAVAFTLAEDVGTGRRISSFFDALWWSTATITTVGYGDIYPITGVGRVIAAFTMLIGISTLAVVTARVAAFLITPSPPDSPQS